MAPWNRPRTSSDLVSPPCQYPMKRVAERKSMHRREPIFDIVRLRETRQAPRCRERQVSGEVDRRYTMIQGFDNGSNNRLRVFSKHLTTEVRLAYCPYPRPWRVLAQGILRCSN